MTGPTEGESEGITVMDLRRGLDDVLDQVVMGKTYTITRRGKAMAVLSKPEPNAVELGAEARRLGLGGLPFECDRPTVCRTWQPTYI